MRTRRQRAQRREARNQERRAFLLAARSLSRELWKLRPHPPRRLSLHVLSSLFRKTAQDAVHCLEQGKEGRKNALDYLHLCVTSASLLADLLEKLAMEGTRGVVGACHRLVESAPPPSPPF